MVDDAGHKAARRGQHPAAELCGKANVSHARWHQHLLEGPAHALAYGGDVCRRVLRAVVDADAAGEVDEPHVDAKLLVQAHGQLEERAGQARVVVVHLRVAGEKRVDAKVLHPQGGKPAEGLLKLRDGHAELGVLGVSDDAVCRLEGAAGVDATAHAGGHPAVQGALEAPHHVEAVQVDDGAHGVCLGKVRVGRVVAREHDALAGHARRLGEGELGGRGAVAAAALLGQDGDDPGVGRGLDGKVLAEARVPGKRGIERTRPLADLGLVVDVERRGMLGADGLELLLANERALLHERGSLPSTC